MGHTHGPYGWGYGRTTPRSCDALAAEMTSLWRQVGNVSGLSACVYTQLSDVEAEWNGLLTYDRLDKCADTLPRLIASEVRAASQRLTRAMSVRGHDGRIVQPT